MSILRLLHSADPVTPLSTRDVWRIDRAGALSRLTRRTETLDPPGPGEVRVAVDAVGLNFADIFACLGLYSATPKGSFIPGLEFAGVVAARGDGADPRFAVGDAVFGLTRFGGYVSAINVPTVALRHLPLGWSFAEGAAYPVQALTAWYGLVTLGAVTRDHVVLVQSAAGGVGLNALTILRALGARTVAVVGNESKREWLQRERGLSRDAIVVRDRAGFPGALDRVLSQMGVRGFNVVFDAVSGPYFQPAYTRLLPEGRYVVYGAADFMTLRLSLTMCSGSTLGRLR
jgi:NADPH:quinone reductase-like Zn-dependent oxidoreductase